MNNKYKIKILIIDDSPLTINILKNNLLNHGYYPYIATSAQKGIARAELISPDLILLDVVLPDGSGIDLCQKIKSNPTTTNIPVIFMTGLPSKQDQIRGFQAGGVDFLTKPLDIDEVLLRINNYLAIKKMQNELKIQNEKLLQEIFQRKKAEQEIKLLNEHLEASVADRTKKLQETNQQLQDAIEKHQQIELMLRKVNQSYKALSECNQAIIRSSDEQDLLNQICQIIVKNCNFKISWIGFLNNHSHQKIRPVASYGLTPDELIEISNDFSISLKEQSDTSPDRNYRYQTVVVKNPNGKLKPDSETHQAQKYKYLSRGSFPMLTHEGEIMGLLIVYAAEDDSLDEKELILLEELAGDIAYGIKSLRTKQERKNALEQLQISEENYRCLVEYNPAAIAVHSQGIIVYMNSAAMKLMGAEDPQQGLGKPVMDFVHPDYREIVKKRIKKAQQENKSSEPIHEKFLTLDGRTIDVEVTSIPTVYQGKSASQVVFWDITKHIEFEQKLKN